MPRLTAAGANAQDVIDTDVIRKTHGLAQKCSQNGIGILTPEACARAINVGRLNAQLCTGLITNGLDNSTPEDRTGAPKSPN